MRFTVSILKDTNRVVGNSESDWSTLRVGSFIRIAEDPQFYTIGKTNKIFYIKDFEVIGENVIQINTDSGINLQEGDTLTISFKEYELLTLLNISNGGRGYRIGDIIVPTNGIPTVNSFDNSTNVVKFKVESTDEKGCITSVSLLSKGKYIEHPSKTFLAQGGTGDGAEFEVEYRLLDDRTLIERMIDFVDTSAHVNTKLRLFYPLPKGLTTGKISIQKWEAFLTSNYLLESKNNASFTISRDFTPTLKLPLMAEGSLTHKMIYNQAMNQLEEEIARLRERISKLES